MWLGPGGRLVPELSGVQAPPQSPEHLVGQVAQCGVVTVTGCSAPVVAARAPADLVNAAKAHQWQASPSRLLRTLRAFTWWERPEARVTGAVPANARSPLAVVNRVGSSPTSPRTRAARIGPRPGASAAPPPVGARRTRSRAGLPVRCEGLHSGDDVDQPGGRGAQGGFHRLGLAQGWGVQVAVNLFDQSRVVAARLSRSSWKRASSARPPEDSSKAPSCTAGSRPWAPSPWPTTRRPRRHRPSARPRSTHRRHPHPPGPPPPPPRRQPRTGPPRRDPPPRPGHPRRPPAGLPQMMGIRS